MLFLDFAEGNMKYVHMLACHGGFAGVLPTGLAGCLSSFLK